MAVLLTIGRKASGKLGDIMRWAWKSGMIAAGLLCQAASIGFAAEAVIYEYDDWSVTIAPRGSSTANAKRVRVTTSTVSPAVHATSIAAKDDNRIQVRPVSLEQVAPAPAPELDAPPTPAVGDVVKPRGTPVTSPTTPEQPLSLSVDPVPPCVNCNEPVITPRLREPDDAVTAIPSQAQLYRDIYFGLPFLRAEYNANPSYRHDTTMELLFNQMRPTVIQRGTTNVNNYGPYGGGYGAGYGYGSWDPPYYPFSYGLRIHHSR
ncbi:hypothetical protein [Schlesneria paludicola]|uniref:hypothetical protein n=1 Tax=Schlesneria paludicola TaxID=360056 RepID=UPI0012FBC0CB|nr:hypothetical protein [Schlesneria paludicola]